MTYENEIYIYHHNYLIEITKLMIQFAVMYLIDDLSACLSIINALD